MTDEKTTKKTKQTLTESPLFLGIVALTTVIILFNMWQISQLATLLSGSAGFMQSTGGGTLSFSGVGEGKVLAPVLLAPGEQPALPGYKTKFKELPTISSNPKKDPTGDPVQDAVNALVPIGTPSYGQQAGVSFDDPIGAQKVLGSYDRSVTLTSEQQNRWQNIVGKFTCDYCCGSPQNPTIITNCGCAHARAWRGLSKWLIANYDDKVSDEQIFGELSRWKTLWYPGPSVQRLLQEQASASGGAAAVSSLDNLPGMVGGC